MTVTEKVITLAFRFLDWWRQDSGPKFTIVVNVEADAEDYDVVELRRLILEKAQKDGERGG